MKGDEQNCDALRTFKRDFKFRAKWIISIEDLSGFYPSVPDGLITFFIALLWIVYQRVGRERTIAGHNRSDRV